MTVQIQKFVQSKEVTGGSGHIEEKKSRDGRRNESGESICC